MRHKFRLTTAFVVRQIFRPSAGAAKTALGLLDQTFKFITVSLSALRNSSILFASSGRGALIAHPPRAGLSAQRLTHIGIMASIQLPSEETVMVGIMALGLQCSGIALTAADMPHERDRDRCEREGAEPAWNPDDAWCPLAGRASSTVLRKASGQY
jgi:hypothetical protein